MEWAREIGFRVVQMLPINEVGRDNSPDNAISSMAIEPTTLELAPGCPEELTREDFEKLSKRYLQLLRRGTVNYQRVRKLETRIA